MASTLPATISVPNETTHTSSRITREGRKITYKLRVIQRPERARACGQGAKSSSDRRPVDPPPIVDLQVLEGDELRDITFAYNANFFLFATLEEARQKVQGRVPVQNTNQPVLTGTPVAGMAYLDRPNPAGYFIFPDLSVRHEGQFRLSFTLFEETKDPKDADNDQPHGDAESSVHGRCEVKSTPFHVFSAKKFPGLTESTTLSRTVADQGCRVRIRRDVRMRRRTEKPSKDWDDHEEDAGQGHSPSPQMHGRQLQALPQSDRQRSESAINNSVPFQQLQQNAQRSNSSQDLQTQYTRQFQQPAEVSQSQQAVPHSPVDNQSLMTSSQVLGTQQHDNIPAQTYSQSHVASYHSSYQPQLVAHSAMQGYQSQQYPYPQAQTHVSQASPQLLPYNFVSQPLYESQVSHLRQPSLDYAITSAHGEYQRDQAQQGLPPAVGVAASDNLHQPNSALPPLQRTDAIKPEALNDSVVPPPSQYNSVLSRPAGGAKRSFGSTFSLQHINEPLRGGARPDVMTESAQDASGGSDEDHEWEVMRMSYRRADGSRVSRVWPQSNI